MAAADKQDLREEYLAAPPEPDARTQIGGGAGSGPSGRGAALHRSRLDVGRGLPAAAHRAGVAELLDDLVRLGIRVLVPVTLPDRDLDWVALARRRRSRDGRGRGR